MDEKELGSIKGWFAGRLPDGWFSGVEVAVEDDQIVVIGTLPETKLGSTPEEKEGAAAGRIARFREETRGHRIGIAREAEELQEVRHLGRQARRRDQALQPWGRRSRRRRSPQRDDPALDAAPPGTARAAGRGAVAGFLVLAPHPNPLP